MSYFPLMIQLGQTPVLLVGGGKTARRKASILKEFGASVDVVAPVIGLFAPADFCRRRSGTAALASGGGSHRRPGCEPGHQRRMPETGHTG